MMSREKAIKALFYGGQAAIAAEVLIVFGVAILLLADLDFTVTHHLTHSKFMFYTEYIAGISQQRWAYLLGMGLSTLSQTIVMLFVIWAWYCYLECEGIQFMNEIARNVAVIGVTSMSLFITLVLVSFPSVGEALETGEITFRDAYGLIGITDAAFTLGITALYGIYPILLALATWRDRLLPRWFQVSTFVLASINLANIALNYKHFWIAAIAGSLLIIYPFLMGVVLLLKAKEMALQEHARKKNDSNTYLMSSSPRLEAATPHSHHH